MYIKKILFMGMSLLLACVYVYHMKPEKGIGFS